MTDTIYKGFDCHKIPRIWGIFESRAECERQALEHAREYINTRRDTGPLRLWTFEYGEAVKK